MKIKCGYIHFYEGLFQQIWNRYLDQQILYIDKPLHIDTHNHSFEEIPSNLFHFHFLQFYFLHFRYL